MRSLGDKISSTIVAQHANVPCMPWSGTGITDTVMSDQGFLTVSDDVYQKACIHSAEEGLEKAEVIGFPVMIKASEGGGGKGELREKGSQGFIRADLSRLQVFECVQTLTISPSSTMPSWEKCLAHLYSS